MGTGHGSPSDNPPVIFFILLIILGLRYLVDGFRRKSNDVDDRRSRLMLRLFELSTEEKNEYTAALWMLGGAASLITGVIGLIWFACSSL